MHCYLKLSFEFVSLSTSVGSFRSSYHKVACLPFCIFAVKDVKFHFLFCPETSSKKHRERICKSAQIQSAHFFPTLPVSSNIIIRIPHINTTATALAACLGITNLAVHPLLFQFNKGRGQEFSEGLCIALNQYPKIDLIDKITIKDYHHIKLLLIDKIRCIE